MTPLDRLLLADLKHMWGQFLAICILLACGVAIFVMSTNTIRSLEESRQRYYQDYRFADAFVSLERAPNQLADRLREIPGVAQVETRVVRAIIVDIPAMAEPATCQLVSTADEPQGELNAVHLRRGQRPNPARRGEVIASEPFAEANGLKPGDELDVIMGGRRERLRVVGIGISPEYIYAVQAGQMLPDDRRHGVLWMPYRQMAAAFNMEGAFNQASLALSARAPLDDVLFQTDLLLKRYGGRAAHGRDDQASHRRIADEMHQLSGMAFVTPLVFLLVAAFLVNLVLSRMVRRQQEQIATLRAFGYTQWEIGRHYLKLIVLLVCIGVGIGAIAGGVLSRELTEHYGRFFHFPALYHAIDWSQAALAGLISLASGLGGGLSAVRRAMSLPPAVAMRPEAPGLYHATFAERLGLGVLFTPIGLMVVRRLERNFRATALSVLGMSLGVAILVMGSFMEDTIQHVIDVQFQQAQRQDVTLTFYEAISPGGVHDVRHLPGVGLVEPFRAAPVRLRRGARSRRVSLLGLEERPQLFRVLDDEQREVALAGAGLTISQKLAELLDVRPGETVSVEFLEGRQEVREAAIAAVFPDYAEPGAYINRRQLHRMLDEGEQLSGAFLSVDSRRLNELYAQLKQTPVIAGVGVKEAAIRNFNDTIAENLRPLRLLNAAFACIIAFGVIYNCALIALAERGRDLATLRVMGFTRREVSLVLLGELAVITLAAIPIGLPAGHGLSYLATLALDTETHRFPLVIHRATFAYAAGVILAAAATAAFLVRRMLDKLDLIAVLKVKE